jgi:photosystem II stability/assembly factor-like uncharacterized protein
MTNFSIARVVSVATAALATVSLVACGGKSASPPTKTPVTYSRVTYGPVAFANTAQGIIAASTPTHSYVLRTADGGQTWTQSNAPVKIIQLAFPDPAHAYALVTSGACLPPTGPNARSIALTSCRSGVMKSVDAGRSWTWAQQLLWPYEPLFFGFVNHNVGWMVLDRGQCLHVPKSLGTRKPKIWHCYRAGYKSSMVTADGGATWSTVLSRVGGLFDLTFTNSKTGWAVSTLGRRQLARLAAHPHPRNNGCVSSLLHTSDGGLNWVRKMHFTLRCQASLSFVSPSRGYLLLTRCQAAKCRQVVLLRTTNHGKNWNRVWRSQATSSNDPKAAISSVLFRTQAVGWLARYAGGQTLQAGLMTTNTGGHSWVWRFKDTAGTSRANMALPNASTGWVVMNIPGCRPVCSRVYNTTDAGKTWNAYNLPLPKSSAK